MKQYLDLMRHAYENGVEKSDRTGTGTRSIFGHQMRFDLSKGFPLLTTKKMFINGMVDELKWFISGSTNANDLPERSKHWWTPWAREDGSLGPIYGEQYNASRWFFCVKPKEFEYVGFSGAISRDVRQSEFSEVHKMLYPTWHRIMTRCYSDKHVAYGNYGGIGVHVCKEWHSFDNFCKDAQELDGWILKKEYPDEYTLDKDIKQMSNRYCKESCMWASDKEQVLNTSTNRPLIGTSPDGVEYFFANSGDAAARFGLGAGNVFHVASGARKAHKGWGFRYVKNEDGTVFRFREVNQLKMLIASLKHNPDSRRHMINLWHTPAMEHAALPCCHGSVIQFYVANGRLSSQVYQRSADILLGVPVNIASYSLLTHMVAQQCDLEVGELIWTGGDCHLYSNHLEQAKLQMSREVRALPELVIKRKPADIFSYKLDDFEIVGYDPHPAIKAEVAV